MVLRVYLEKVEGQYQGACFRFAEELQCGVLRLAWDAAGDLLVGQSNRGWNSLGNRSFGLQKIHWTSEVPFEILRIQHEGLRHRQRLGDPGALNDQIVKLPLLA